MATSDNTVDVVENRRIDRSIFTAVSRYDLVLAVIPAVLLVSILVGYLSSVPSHVAVAVASLIGALAVIDALFVNPPGAGER